MRYDIDPKTLKKASPRPVEINPRPVVITNTIVFDGKETETGQISSLFQGLSGTLQCYTELLRAGASHDTVSHNKKTKVLSVVSGVLNVDFYGPASEEQYAEIVCRRKKSLITGETLQLNPGDIYRLYAGNTEVLFTVVQESSYESRLVVINKTKSVGEFQSVIPSSRYKSKAREQLAMLNPQDLQINQSNTKAVADEGLNLRPMSVSELESL